ncbi:MAG TPA: ABC transporter permease [Pyrinomonadaceae bacterium]|nr:ABC transporter permease [Pyrinomonadaceae bacterium]
MNSELFMPEESAVKPTSAREAAETRAPREAVEARVVNEGADARAARDAATAAAPEAPRSSSPARVFAIARNTFREAVRDRVLYNLVIFVLLLTGGAVFLGELSAAQEAKIIVDMGLSAMLLFGVFIAIFVGVGLVYKEIERRTVYAIFSKPVGRGEFLLGKYLGLCATLAVNVAVMGAGVSLALLYVRGGYDPLAAQIWPAVALVYVELMIVVAAALLFSSFSSPALSALLTFFVFVIGHFSAELKTLSASFASGGARALFAALYYLLPNLSNYAYITAASHGETPTAANFSGAVLYGLAYIAVLLAASTLVFKRRNFK